MSETPLNKAIVLIKENKPVLALVILEKMIREYPEDHSCLPWLAQCYLSTDRLAEARTALDTALKVKVPCQYIEPVVKNFCNYYLGKEDFAEAEKLLKTAVLSCSIQEFQEERKSLYKQWAEYEARSLNFGQAISHLEIVLSLSSNGYDENLKHNIADLSRKQAAIEEIQNENDNEAIKLLEKSLLISDEALTRMALGNLYCRKGDITKAINNFRALIILDDNNLEARHKLVELCLKQNDHEAAQNALTELSEREHSLDNYQLLATVSLKLNNYAGAVRAMEAAIELEPKNLSSLMKLKEILDLWWKDLIINRKIDQAASVKGRLDRIAELIKSIELENSPEQEKLNPEGMDEFLFAGCPLALTSSRISLAKGSLTPEGEIKIKNLGQVPLTDISLTLAFYDNTIKKRTGAVTISASSTNYPILSQQTRTIYFSSPNIVRKDHKLSVLLLWKGKLIRELPVVKEKS